MDNKRPLTLKRTYTLTKTGEEVHFIFEIDLDEICSVMADKVLSNKSGKSTAMDSAIKAKKVDSL